MHIRSLQVENFKAITSVNLEGLGGMVVVAGPNGCGKSCLLDAIRLLKSVTGDYNRGEAQSWFGEFQIATPSGRGHALREVFQDRSKSLRLAMTIELAASEREYLLLNAREVVEHQLLRDLNQQDIMPHMMQTGPTAALYRQQLDGQRGALDQAVAALKEDLVKAVHFAEVTVSPSGQEQISVSDTLALVFSTFRPEHLGIFDYHGAARHFAREQVGGVTLTGEGYAAQLRQGALYNYASKYSNIKTEMASDYVRDLIAKQSGAAVRRSPLYETLAELFRTFFPGKEFVGPTPTADGQILFQVRTASGLHDLNELSSGEKEIVFGYLRLRNSAPRNSVIMLDEPELHLNPRLMRGLASFYKTHVSDAMGSQIWMVTHSDALIRDAIMVPGFSVYHLQASAMGKENQGHSNRWRR